MNTTQDVMNQILTVAKQEKVAWIEAFLREGQIKSTADIAERTDAALAQYAGPDWTETIRTPKQVAIAGGDVEDCAAFAIALAIGLGLPYELTIRADKQLVLRVGNIQILPSRT